MVDNLLSYFLILYLKSSVINTKHQLSNYTQPCQYHVTITLHQIPFYCLSLHNQRHRPLYSPPSSSLSFYHHHPLPISPPTPTLTPLTTTRLTTRPQAIHMRTNTFHASSSTPILVGTSCSTGQQTPSTNSTRTKLFSTSRWHILATLKKSVALEKRLELRVHLRDRFAARKEILRMLEHTLQNVCIFLQDINTKKFSFVLSCRQHRKL